MWVCLQLWRHPWKCTINPTKTPGRLCNFVPCLSCINVACLPALNNKGGLLRAFSKNVLCCTSMLVCKPWIPIPPILVGVVWEGGGMTRWLRQIKQRKISIFVFQIIQYSFANHSIFVCKSVSICLQINAGGSCMRGRRDDLVIASNQAEKDFNFCFPNYSTFVCK